MKSSISAPFYYQNNRNDLLDEFNIRYTPGVNDGMKLVEFIGEFKDKYINIEMPNGIDVDAILSLRSFDNVRIRICRLQDMPACVKLNEKHIPFFFDERLCACNWKQLRDQISLGCCQIYIADDLTHELDKVYNVCHDNDVGVRCVINHVHSTGPYRGDNATDWFIRPESIDDISKFYDVFEFDCSYAKKDGEYEWSKFDVLYDVFFKKKKYIGNLQEINWQLGFEFNSMYYDNVYDLRSNCGFHCASGSKCKLCDHAVELADILCKKGIVIKREEQV